MTSVYRAGHAVDEMIRDAVREQLGDYETNQQVSIGLALQFIVQAMGRDADDDKGARSDVQTAVAWIVRKIEKETV